MKARKEQLEEQRIALKLKGGPGNELVKVERELATLRQEIKFLEASLVQKAQIVATSISKATIDKAIYGIGFDVVLLDEASMAYIPQAFYAATLAKKHVIYIGDFRQLPPEKAERFTNRY